MASKATLNSTLSAPGGEHREAKQRVMVHSAAKYADKQEAFGGLSKVIDDVLYSVASLSREKPMKEQPDGLSLQLAASQRLAFEAVGRHWQASYFGLQLKGPKSSGKTIAACALLFKNRGLGPQLVVCYSLSLVSKRPRGTSRLAYRDNAYLTVLLCR
jgi:hypothetical protein